MSIYFFFFFFQAEDGMRDWSVTGVQTCALPISEPMRILVVEDDKKIASFVVNGLKQSGYAADHSADGESGLITAQSISYDAAVVDIMLPKLDGLSLIQQLRAKGIRIPILILSAKASVDDRVKG